MAWLTVPPLSLKVTACRSAKMAASVGSNRWACAGERTPASAAISSMAARRAGMRRSVAKASDRTDGT